MKQILKHFLKKYFYYFFIRSKFHPSLQILQKQLYLGYRRDLQENNLNKLSETGFKVFSQFEEDGLLLFIFSLIGMTNKNFIEIGSDDGINSNCANLYFNHGWHGLFIDANKKSIEIGKRFFNKHPHPWMYKPKFLIAKVKRENINQLIKGQNFEGEIGLLSIDIDGNDYWIWDAINIVTPQVVIIETHNEFGLNNIVVPYDPDYMAPGKHPVYHGASPVAMTKLASRKGYRLIGANQYGFNFIFIQNELLKKELPTVTVESLLIHKSVSEGYGKFEEIKDWEYLEG